MDSCIGLIGKDFVIMATDTGLVRSIFKLNDKEDKILVIDDNKIMGIAGETSDRLVFGDWVSKNISLYKYSHGYQLSTQESANFIRSELAYAIRNGPYNVNCLLGGVDEDGPGLYFMDYMGTMQKTHVAAHGYGGMFLWGILDNQWRKIRTRFLVNSPNFVVKVVTKEGVKIVNI